MARRSFGIPLERQTAIAKARKKTAGVKPAARDFISAVVV
jgi:hypothetical protein